MAGPPIIPEMVEYRVVLIEPESYAVLALDTEGGYCLARVRIPQSMRQAQQLRNAIQAMWGLQVLILDFLVADDDLTPSVVAQLVTAAQKTAVFKAITLEQLPPSELSERENSAVALVLNGETAQFFSRLGWINEAATWVEGATGRRLSSKGDIEQLNAGGGFALVRFRTEDGHGYWLKATGAPNGHECALTTCLCELCPNCLPRLIAVKREWNAWLTEDVGKHLPDPPTMDALASAATSLVSLQLRTVDCLDLLLVAGAFDQRPPVLRSNIDQIAAYLIGAMAQQSSTRVAPLSRDRLLELAEILRDACLRMEALNISDTLIHNDLNAGNILYDGTRCVFIDWSEAAIGNPFLSCERLCQLNPEHRESICSIYRKPWLDRLDAAVVGEAFALMPLLAIYAYLYGRGDWIAGVKSRPQFESYARSLARHMDRAAKTPELLEALCR